MNCPLHCGQLRSADNRHKAVCRLHQSQGLSRTTPRRKSIAERKRRDHPSRYDEINRYAVCCSAASCWRPSSNRKAIDGPAGPRFTVQRRKTTGDRPPRGMRAGGRRTSRSSLVSQAAPFASSASSTGYWRRLSGWRRGQCLPPMPSADSCRRIRP